MALVVKDRVRETSTTTGTGTITLAGAVTGYQSFSAIGNANTTYYTIYLQGGNEWEVGIGTYTASGTTLSRDTILASSNGGSAVNFSAGVKDVFVTYPAGRSVYYDTATNVTLNALTLSGGTANGVLYLNGSKVATSGSALTFDGTNLSAGSSSQNLGTASARWGTVYATALSDGTDQLVGSSGTAVRIGYGASWTAQAFAIGASEQMRLTSTGLGIGTSSPGAKLDVQGTALRLNLQSTSNGQYATWKYVGKTSAGAAVDFEQGINITADNAFEIYDNTNTQNVSRYFNGASGYWQWFTNGTEKMRIDSSGNLGIGTSSPGVKLEVLVADAATATKWVASTGRLRLRPYADATNGAIFESTNAAESSYLPLSLFGSTVRLGNGAQAIIDSSGNLGLGVTPSAWGFGGNLELPATNNIAFQGAYGNILSNAYYDLGQARFEYTVNGFAAWYQIGSAGQHKWFTAPSGNAGDPITFTQVMTLLANGNLGIGETNPGWKLQVNGTAGVQTSNANAAEFHVNNTSTSARDWVLISSGSAWAGGGQTGYFNIYDNTAGQQRLTIDTSGNLGIGTSSPVNKFVVSNAGANGLEVNPTSGVSSGASLNGYNRSTSAFTPLTYTALAHYFQVGSSPATAATLDASGNLGLGVTPSVYTANSRVFQVDGGANAAEIKLTNNTSGASGATGAIFQMTGNDLYIWNSENSFLSLGTNNTERARITSDGNLLVGGNSAAALDGVRGIVAGGSSQTNGGVAYESSTSQWLTYTDSAQALIFYDSRQNTERARITSGGNFVVGDTSAPARIYSVNTAGFSLGLAGSTKGIRVEHNTTESVIQGVDNTLNVSYQPIMLSGDIVKFGIQGSEKARITSGGEFVIANGSTQVVTLTTGASTSYTNTANSSSFQTGLLGGASDATAYIYQRANSAMVFGTNNTERARITSGGNLGVGTNNPTWRLVVNDASGGGIQIENSSDSNRGGRIIATGSAGSGTFAVNTTSSGYALTFGIDGTEKARIDTLGNVGIGTTNPAYKLNIKSTETSSTTTPVFTLGLNRQNSDTAGLLLGMDANADAVIAPNNAALRFGNVFTGTFSEYARFTSNGSLGIGESNPESYGKVVIRKDTASGAGSSNASCLWLLNANTTANNASSIFFGDNATTAAGGINFINTDHTNEYGVITFDTRGSGGYGERARITSGGYFKASDNGTYTSAGFFHEFFQSNNNEALVVRTINASQTSSTFFVQADRNTTNNTFYAIDYYNGGGTAYRFRVADSGNVTNTNGSYGTISDAKMKTDIVDAGSQWSDIKGLRFRKFKMKDDPEQIVQLGVVAQEVEQVSPGLVEEHIDRDVEGNDLGTTTKSVKTSVLLMKAAVALQEAMARIEKLEAEMAALKGV